MSYNGLIDPDKAIDLVAAFAGSAIALFARPGIGRWEAIGIFVAGQAVAYLGTVYISSFLPPGDGLRGMVGFLCGVLAFPLIVRILAWVRKGRLPYIGGEGGDEK